MQPPTTAYARCMPGTRCVRAHACVLCPRVHLARYTYVRCIHKSIYLSIDGYRELHIHAYLWLYLYTHTHTCIPMYIYVYVYVRTCMLRFACESEASAPHSHGLTRTDGSVFVYIPYTYPALYAYRCPRVTPRRICATYAPRQACMRAGALVCVRGHAPIRANACEHFTPPPSVEVSARRRSAWRRPSTRTSASGTPRESRTCPSYAPLPARPRTAADCARSVVDACAAVVRGGAADMFVCARASACSYANKGVCGSISRGSTHVPVCHRASSTPRPIDVHSTHAYNCSSFNAHLYPYLRLHRACARACARARVHSRVSVYGGALHACKLRKSVNILARVLYG
jgi:hypothetical protein